MGYEMEELVPIVGKLAEKYTKYESTSITYEKAEQLMGAVLYCIHETEQAGGDSVIPSEGISAQQAYEAGTMYVEEKVKKALNLYNEVSARFVYYGNRCLYDTFITGLPEFFKRYDMKYEPQATILTLDYPVLKDISRYTGIDKIYEFIVCIGLEQTFLQAFPEEYVINVLSKYNRQYRDMVDNICEIVFANVLGHIMAGKRLSEASFEEEDYLHVQKIFMQTEFSAVNGQMESAARALIQKYYDNRIDLLEYLNGSINNIAVRLKNAADHGSLYRIL